MSNAEYMVFLDDVDKTFHTRHFFKRDESGQRRFYHKKTVRAVDHVTFGIRPGEIFGLLGPNGAGKTTLVKMISGLVRPDSGVVSVDGLDVERKRLQVLKRIGVVLEGTRTSIWPLTPMENLMYYGNLKNMRGRALRKRARELLEFIGLKDKMDVQVRQLSRGQKQKVAICIALISDPQVVLLDEPTTGLDVQSSRSIKDKIIEMTRAHRKSVLVTTHDMNVAQELCDRIGIIHQGKLIACRPTGELLSLFGENAFEFHLDRLPEPYAFDGVPGLLETECCNNGDGPQCVFRLESEPDVRSEALYGIMDRLRAGGFRVHSITQRAQRLEDVFLRLTADKPAAPAPQRAPGLEGAEVRQ
jgi:ABC-2 type transport system ATP-binding protein